MTVIERDIESGDKRQGVIAIIPARSGSKRIPLKNVRPLGGQPLLAWTIRNALAAKLFDSVVVSTDSRTIAGVARQHGAAVPFIRPRNLSLDSTPTAPVVRHALQEIGITGASNKIVFCLYPAAFAIDARDFDRGLGLLEQAKTPFVASVSRYRHPIQRAFSLNTDGSLEFVDKSALGRRTQELPEMWHDAGQFYCGSASSWASGLPLLENCTGLVLEHSQAVDLDTEEDWTLLEALFHTTRSNNWGQESETDWPPRLR